MSKLSDMTKKIREEREAKESLTPIEGKKRELKDFFPKERVKPVLIIDYAQTEMRTLFQKPFSEVDSLILSQLSYMQLGCLVGNEKENKAAVPVSALFKAEKFDEILDEVRDAPKNKELLFALCASPRYRDILINYYTNKVDEKEEKQFCAMTFFLPTGEIYVAFRGTDSTVVGWKEDFNMTFISPVPSQLSAVGYLEQVAGKTHGPLYVGGHSKGGNLALYSAIYAPISVQDRIITAFSHDGPGLKDSIMAETGYENLREKIHVSLPKSSMIGMIFENQAYRVVKSNRMGIMQHDPFSWEIDGDDFAYTDALTDSSLFMNETMNTWLESLSEDQRKVFVDTLFDILEAAGTKSFADWPQGAIREADNILKAAANIDEETSKGISLIMGELFKISVKNVFDMSREKAAERELARAEEAGERELAKAEEAAQDLAPQ